MPKFQEAAAADCPRLAELNGFGYFKAYYLGLVNSHFASRCHSQI